MPIHKFAWTRYLIALLFAWVAPAFAVGYVSSPSVGAEFDHGPQIFGQYKTEERWGTYESEAAQGKVRYFIVKPEGKQTYPGIYYIYGRPGLDHRLLPELRRLASYGFTVFVAHFQEALLIPILLPSNDPPETLQVQVDGFDAFIRLHERRPGPVCVVSTVRGGNFGIPLSARPEVGCYVGLHAVLIYHGWPEQYQDITIMPEIRNHKKPTLLMVGNTDFEARYNQSKRTAQYLKRANVPVELVIYPEANRGFDFRVVGRTLGDDMAKLDSMNRTVAFISRYTKPDQPALATGATESAPIPDNIRPATKPSNKVRDSVSSGGGE